MQNMPTVSALMPAYNAEEFIGEAIESVLAQGYEDLEIVVVDDGSTDKTADIAEKYPKVRCIRKEHSGISDTRNRTLKEASGEYVTFIDADDLWVEGKLKKQLDFLEQHPEYDCVCSKMRNFTRIPQDEITYEQQDLLEYKVLNLLGMYCIRKSAVDALGLFDATLPYDEDTEWLFRMKVMGMKIGNIDEVHLLRRIHSKNVSVKRAEDKSVVDFDRLKKIWTRSIRSRIKLQK